jgi:hypothetical protein
MSDSNNVLERIEQLAQELFLQERKIYTAGLLVPRFKEAAARNRHDITINQAAFVLDQVASKNPSREISASDLKELASTFYSPSTNFHHEFADLLEDEQASISQKQASRLDFHGHARDITLNETYKKAEVIVDDSLLLTPSEEGLASQAVQLINDELAQTGLVVQASSVLKFKDNSKLVFQTKLKTASNEIEVVVPVEVVDEVPLFPQVLATTEKVYTLDNQGLSDLIADTEASTLRKRAEHISSLRTAEDYDMALRSDTRGQYAEEVDEFEVEAPKVVSLGHTEIEQVLRDAVLAKDSKYTEQTRYAGRELVESELNQMGFFNSQVKFDGDYEHGLTYKASLNTGVGRLDVVMPVEIHPSQKIMLPPSQFKAANQEEIHTLTKEAVLQVARVTKTASAEVSPLLFAMSYPDLRKQLKIAAQNRKHKTAQQIINIVDEKFGDYYRNAATDDYQTWLEESSANYESRCGGCDHYAPKTAQVHNDYCNLLKTASKNVQQDQQTDICVRSTFANLEEAQTFLDNGENIKINWED